MRLNSGASSRNSTPRCAFDTHPGRGMPLPPPRIAGAEALWCGASNGGVRTSSRSGVPPAVRERMAVTSMAASSSSGGRMLGSRSASMVFPDPGGPVKSRWCPPAAAISRANLPWACPATSDISEGIPCSGISAAGCSRMLSGGYLRFSAEAPRATNISARHLNPLTCIPGMSAASCIFWAGTTTRECPASAAALTAGSMPGMGRIDPSSPTSPRKTQSPLGLSFFSACRAATTIATSNPEPFLGRVAGVRLMVSRCWVSPIPEFLAAERTRSFDSFSAVSGSPRSTKDGRAEETSASTSTMCPRSPTSATE